MLAPVWFGLVLIGTALGAGPTKCCFDKQYSVIFGAVGEVLVDDVDSAFFIDGYIKYGFDYYRDRQGLISILRNQDGSTYQRYELKDYAARRVYSKFDNGLCTYSDLPSFDVMRPPCIPDNATYMGPSVIGYGAHSMKMHSWAFTFPMAADKNSQIILAVTEDHCVPVMETVVGSYLGTPIEESLFFNSYHPSIENINSLDIPDGCQEATSPPSTV